MNGVNKYLDLARPSISLSLYSVLLPEVWVPNAFCVSRKMGRSPKIMDDVMHRRIMDDVMPCEQWAHALSRETLISSVD